LFLVFIVTLKSSQAVNACHGHGHGHGLFSWRSFLSDGFYFFLCCRYKIITERKALSAGAHFEYEVFIFIVCCHYKFITGCKALSAGGQTTKKYLEKMGMFTVFLYNFAQLYVCFVVMFFQDICT
jgi:hypothetical protein